MSKKTVDLMWEAVQNKGEFVIVKDGVRALWDGRHFWTVGPARDISVLCVSRSAKGFDLPEFLYMGKANVIYSPFSDAKVALTAMEPEAKIPYPVVCAMCDHLGIPTSPPNGYGESTDDGERAASVKESSE